MPYKYCPQTVLPLIAGMTMVWTGTAAHARRDALSAYRNQNRVLLVFAPAAKDSRFAQQQRILDSDLPGVKDRDLVRFAILEKGQSRGPQGPLTATEAATLRRRFGVSSGAFRVVLVGKDGHTAYSGSRPITTRSLFERIDRMPMRRDEMRRRGR